MLSDVVNGIGYVSLVSSFLFGHTIISQANKDSVKFRIFYGALCCSLCTIVGDYANKKAFDLRKIILGPALGGLFGLIMPGLPWSACASFVISAALQDNDLFPPPPPAPLEMQAQ